MFGMIVVGALLPLIALAIAWAVLGCMRCFSAGCLGIGSLGWYGSPESGERGPCSWW